MATSGAQLAPSMAAAAAAAAGEMELTLAARPLWLHSAIGFVAGGAYGLTSVVVGQPLDTVKTRMQACPKLLHERPQRVAYDLARTQGVVGLYRGGVPVFLGGTLFRSAQFGVYEVALRNLRKATPGHKILGVLDWQIAAAGVAGGVARGLIEAPFDAVKVARQVEQQWCWRTLFRGSGVTIGRNAALFCSFSVYRDWLPQLVPGGLGPFWMGAVCSNLAWLTIWPLDVVKSQRQSGLFPNQSSFALLAHAYRDGLLHRGLAPGLARSTLANGFAMMAYKKIEEVADTRLPQWR